MGLQPAALGLLPAAQTSLPSETDARRLPIPCPRRSIPTSPMEPPAIRRRGAEDHISVLPDELVHTILVRLPSAAAAARTSILSRRWRGVWADMPELVLGGSPAPATTTSALLDSIDCALNSYAAPMLHSLKIEVSGVDRCDVPAHRISPWLHFASQRLVGKLRLRLDLKRDLDRYGDILEELALPICERATEIDLGYLTGFVLRLPRTGSFSALACLMISCRQMDGGELGRVVSSPQCPRLQKLYISVRILEPGVSICSESLKCLYYSSGVKSTGMLEVNAPMLQVISVSSRAAKACIVAPKLEAVGWSGTFNPGLHEFPVGGRHLNSLSIVHSSFLGILISSTRLLERYDTVKELQVSLGLYKERSGYTTFLKEMDKLPVCESLAIFFSANHHALPAMMFHLLRRCSCIRKLKLFLDWNSPPKITSCIVSGCPCVLPENYRFDDITFDSLEEIGINFFTGSDEHEQFMKLLLSKCNMRTLKRVDITVPFDPISSEIMVVVDRIRGVCHPDRKVQFNVLPKVPIQFDS